MTMSMFPDEIESRMKRGTTGVVRYKWLDENNVQHFLVVIEDHPDQQKYRDMTGTATLHRSE